MKAESRPVIIRWVLTAVCAVVLLAPLFFCNSKTSADAPSVKITVPAEKDVITLDSNSFNLAITYHVDIEKNAGMIVTYLVNSNAEKIRLDDCSTFNPSGVYPCTFTHKASVWVPDPPPGGYIIRAEMWRSEYRQAKVGDLTSVSAWYPVERIAVDEITVTIRSTATPTPLTTPPTTTSTPSATTTVPVKTTATIPPGAIYIQSDPGDAEIWINGIKRVNTNFGASPVGFTDLAPGKYKVYLRKAGYLDYMEEVNLVSNQIYSIKAVLKTGTTPTGWITIDSDPSQAKVFINGKEITTTPTTLTDVQPGTYDLTLTKEGYEDWNDKIAVSAGAITSVNATLPLKSGGVPIAAVAGGAAVLAVAAWLIKMMAGRGKGASLKDALYQEWWNKASPADRKNWDSFEKFLTDRLGTPQLTGFIDQYGKPSWASAHTSWQAEVKKGTTKSTFEEWVNEHSANQQMTNEMFDRAERNRNFRPKEIVEASQNYSEALRNKERLEKLTQIQKAVANDSRLSEFANDAGNIIVDTEGHVDANKLNRLEGTLQHWIVRDKMLPQVQDYTYTDAYFDTVRQGSQNVVIRVGAAYLSGGYSEMVLNPISAVSTMRQSIMEGKSTYQAVKDGYVQSSFELALGESGRLVKYVSPYIKGAEESYNLTRLSKYNSELSSEVSTINQLANQAEDVGRYSRDAFMKSSEVVKVGKTAAAGLDEAEKLALKLNNNPEFRKLMAENSNLVPSKVKDVMGIAKQKVYENARNSAIDDVVGQMSKEGVPAGEDPFFIKQTGTHARPGNPGWNSLKSDFDHSVDFGSAERNAFYEKQFNAHLEGQGTSAAAIDANVYGTGTSSRGAYTGGATKFVENYNQTNGSDIMIRAKDGITTISREEPQTIDSLLSKMKPEDISSAKDNYQDFFQKSLDKGGSLDNMIKNSSKEVSRTTGQYSVEYVEHFQNTGGVNYQVPDAARVADLIKKKCFSVDDAMQQVGYKGSKAQLLADFKKIMGV